MKLTCTMLIHMALPGHSGIPKQGTRPGSRAVIWLCNAIRELGIVKKLLCCKYLKKTVSPSSLNLWCSSSPSFAHPWRTSSRRPSQKWDRPDIRIRLSRQIRLIPGSKVPIQSRIPTRHSNLSTTKSTTTTREDIWIRYERFGSKMLEIILPSWSPQ